MDRIYIFMVIILSLLCSSLATNRFPAYDNDPGFRTVITRKNSSLYDRIQASHRRAKLLSTGKHRPRSGDDIPKQTLSTVDGGFTMNLDIGTPPQTVKLIFDTGSDLTWMACSTSGYKPYFHEQRSSTYRTVPCSSSECTLLDSYSCSSGDCAYTYTYGSGDELSGILATETVSLSTDSRRFQGITVGCGKHLDMELDGDIEGIVGFGRGPLSLPSQLTLQSIDTKFSYCLDGDTSSNPFFMGSAADIRGSDVQSTRLLPSSYYSVNLSGIYVGSSDIPINLQDFGETILDSGTTLTYLSDSVYSSIKDTFQSQISLKSTVAYSFMGFDLCYNMSDNPKYKFPELRFEFEGKAEMNLPVDNYFISMDDGNQVRCLALQSNTGLGLNIIGNIQQQGFQILFDVANSRLSFAPARCNKL